jgi:molybdopterin-binding protein
MKLSARNVLKGRVVTIVRGATTAHVKVDVNGTIVTASITNEAVDELRLREGDEAYAVVKASPSPSSTAVGCGRACRPWPARDVGLT